MNSFRASLSSDSFSGVSCFAGGVVDVVGTSICDV